MEIGGRAPKFTLPGTEGNEITQYTLDDHIERGVINQYELPFPLLSDNNGAVSADYDLQYDEYEQHEAVSQRALVVVDDTQEIVYRWTADDASAEFDISVLDDVRTNVDVFSSPE